jgi:hypothetical protein
VDVTGYRSSQRGRPGRNRVIPSSCGDVQLKPPDTG